MVSFLRECVSSNQESGCAPLGISFGDTGVGSVDCPPSKPTPRAPGTKKSLTHTMLIWDIILVIEQRTGFLFKYVQKI